MLTDAFVQAPLCEEATGSVTRFGLLDAKRFNQGFVRKWNTSVRSDRTFVPSFAGRGNLESTRSVSILASYQISCGASTLA